MATRIRCSCGRVYDPEAHNVCPDCGAPHEQRVAAPEPPPVVERSEVIRRDETRQLVTPAPNLFTPRNLLVAAGALLLIMMLVLLVRRGGTEKTATIAKEDRGTTPAQNDEHSTPSNQAPPPTMIGSDTDIAALIAKAPAGGTVKLPPGIYPGGTVIKRPVRIVGANGQVVIQSEGKECLSVRAKGVSVQNVQFWGNGIGDLPAISIEEGAELDMDNCKVQSGSGVAVSVATNSSFKALGSGFSAQNGSAVRLRLQSHGNFTQCSFTDAQTALEATDGSNAELHSCAFERNGGVNSNGTIISLTGTDTKVTTDDCHFVGNYSAIVGANNAVLSVTNGEFKGNASNNTRALGSLGVTLVEQGARATFTGVAFDSNRGGVSAIDGATVELSNCRFSNVGVSPSRLISAAQVAVSALGQNSTATVKSCTFADCGPYGIAAAWGATATVDDCQISGARGWAINVGDPKGQPAQLKLTRGHIDGNNGGVTVIAASEAEISDSEFRDNSADALSASDRSKVRLTKTVFRGNRDDAIHAVSEAEVVATDCDIQGNMRGVVSGQSRKAAQRASIRLENCRVTDNQQAGVIAATQSQVALVATTLENNGRNNIVKENGANVQSDAVAAAASPSPPPADASPAEKKSAPAKSTSRRNTPDRRRTPPEENVAKILRSLLSRP